MPARRTATNRGVAANRGVAVNRGVASNRLNVDGSGGGGSTDDVIFLASIALDSVQTFSAISGAYRHLQVFWTAQGTTAVAKAVQINFNADGGSNFDANFLANSGTGQTPGGAVAQTVIRIGRMPGSDGTGFASGSFFIPYYTLTVNRKAACGLTQSPETNLASGQFTEMDSGSWRTINTAITSITFSASAGAFAAGSVASLYGIS